MMQLELFLLGSGVVRCETELRFRTRKVLALLVFLALEGGLQSRTRLAGLFWMDASPEAGRNSLRNTLSYLREALGGEQFLRIERQAIGLNFEVGVMVDVLELEKAAKLALEPRDTALEAQILSLQSAASLYQGDFLTGFVLLGDSEFDTWLLEQREVCKRNVQIVLERLTKLQSEAGRFSSAIETASRLVALDRLNEAAYRIWIGLQHASGDRVGALKSFEDLQRTLRQEFNLEPSPETLALVERVRLETATARAPRVPSLPTLLLEGRMVGRVTEFVRLVEAYHASALGQTRFVSISGEPGIGKTRLANDFLTWAGTQGAIVLRGRAFETGAGLAYQAITDVLRRYLRTVSDPLTILRPVWLAELARLLPELLELVPDLPTPSAEDTVARTRLFEAVARFGLGLAARVPVVVFIDDLQWADQASLELIAYIARRWLEDESPILMVFTVRSEALTGTDLQTWMTSLAQELPSLKLELEALSFEDTARFVETMGGASPEFSSWLFQETGGQPLFISETLKSLAERGLIVPQAGSWQVNVQTMRSIQTAPGVRSVIQARFGRLSNDARAILEAGAVLGQGFEFSVVCVVTKLEEQPALNALDELLRSRLILEIGAHYVFSHDKVRETAFEEATDARRRVYHRRAFQCLSDAHTPTFVLARHAHGAHLWLEAFRASVQAGDDASKVYAWRAAAEHYEQARAVLIEHPDGVDISAELSEREMSTMYARLSNRYRTLNEDHRVQALPSEVLMLAQKLGHPRLEAHGLLFESNLMQNVEAVFERLERAKIIFLELSDKEGLFEIELSRLYGLRIQSGHGHMLESIALLERMLPQALELGKVQTEDILRSLADFHQASGQWQQAIPYWQQAAEMRSEVRTDNQSYLRENLGFCQLNIGDLAFALANFQLAYQIKVEIDVNPTWIAMAQCFLSYALLETGNVHQALGLTQTAFALRHKSKTRFATEFGLAFALARIAAGQFMEAREALESCIKLIEAQNEVEMQIWGRHFLEFLESHLCSVFALQGDWAVALEHARNAVGWRSESHNERGLHAPRLKHWLEVEALLRGGEITLALQTVERLETVVVAGERLEISALHARAVLEAWNGKTKLVIRLLEKAKRIATRLGLPLEVRSLEALHF